MHLLQSYGLNVTQPTKDFFNNSSENLNYRQYIDRLQLQTDGLWHYAPNQGTRKILPVANKPRFTYTSLDNSIAPNDPVISQMKSVFAAQQPKKFTELYHKLAQQGIDHRRLTLLPYIFKRRNCDTVSIQEFEETLKPLQFSIPEECLADLILALQNNGEIHLSAVREMLGEV